MAQLPGKSKLPILGSPEDEAEVLSASIRERASPTGKLKILDAGCGRKWPLDLNGIDYSLTGVDINEESLRLRMEEQNDLDEVLVGDLRTVELEEEAFDVVFSSFVLEHIRGAEAVLGRFARWLKPGGLLLLQIPDRDSVYGFIARETPFWFHVFYKRFVTRTPNAGKPGFGPFPTQYDPVVSRRGVHDYCRRHGLRILHEYGSNYYLRRFGALAGVADAFLNLVELASLRYLSADHNNLVFIIEKPRGS